MPNDDWAIQLAVRSISLKCIIELWSYSTCNNEQFHTDLRQFIEIHRTELANVFCESQTFKIFVETYNRHFGQCEKVNKIEMFDYLPNMGAVNLKNPHITYYFIEYYGMDALNVPELPMALIFGKWVSCSWKSNPLNFPYIYFFFDLYPKVVQR